MNYFSLTSRSIQRDFASALREGLAPDRGLYVPENIPRLDWASLSGSTLPELATRMLLPYVEGAILETRLFDLMADALNFEIPLVQVDEKVSQLELFHGPTAAFKDVGARVMSRLLGATSTERLTILVATSGDTGSAVAQGFYNVPGIDVVILYPSGRISRIQEQQLTTVGANVRAVEVQGSFDDCQRLVKEAFSDREVQLRRPLTSANSINIGRWIPQSIYYVWATLQAGEAVEFTVPSGNFGNIAAGLLANRMGMSSAGFHAAVNANDVMEQYMHTGQYRPSESQATISNAMDVGDPSNRPRLEWLYNWDMKRMQREFRVSSVSEESTRSSMLRLWEDSAKLVCPHTAIGFEAVSRSAHRGHRVVLATAHAAKFGGVVEEATGQIPEIPDALLGCLDKPKESALLPTDYAAFRSYLLQA
ncbi:MAG: threonine synthase [Flavobacteriales bacterium]|nr:threonine synthase [Flavobacteriales bacterium]